MDQMGPLILGPPGSGTVNVLDLVSQLRDVVLTNVYLDLGNPRGAGILG